MVWAASSLYIRDITQFNKMSSILHIDIVKKALPNTDMHT